MIEFRHLASHKNPKIRATWSESASNELGMLFQGAGRNNKGSQRTKVTNAFFFISREKVPNIKIKDITYARVVCNIREIKKDKHRTRTAVGGNNVKYEGNEGTPTAHLETAKMLFNSALSRKHVKFMTIDMSNFYLVAPLENMNV